MAHVDTEYVEPTYGNWRLPQRAGIGRLSGLATALLFVTIIITIFVMRLAGIIPGLIIGVILALFLGSFALKDKHGYTLMERLSERLIFMFARFRKLNIFRSGPLGATPTNEFRLPGVASSAVTYEGTDSVGRPFALIHMPAVSIYSVSMAVEPDGAAMVDQADIDQWVANWGGFLAELGREVGLVGASVTVETSPGSGIRLRREIESSMSNTASPIASQMLAEAAQTYPSGVSETRAWVTLSFSAAARSGMRRRTPDEMLRDLSSKVVFWCSHLEATGAGTATPMVATEIGQIVRAAYDPAAARLLDQAAYAGEPLTIDLSSAGPSTAVVEWSHYRHDSGLSVCWTMSEAPRGAVFSNVFARLLEPHAMIGRKRVTMLYRPVDSALTAAMVEQDQNTARTRLTSTRNGSARLSAELDAANATAADEARGAGLTYVGLAVCATVETPAEMADAVAVVEQELAPSSRIMLRRAWGAHDAVFAATLPLGVVLGRHTVLPESVKSAL